MTCTCKLACIRSAVSAKSRDVEAISHALVAIRRSQSRRTLARLSGPHPLPDAVYELLDAVTSAPTVTEAAAALGVDQPRASRLAAQAVEAGLIARGVDDEDGRRSPLTLTDAGRDVLDAMKAFRARMVGEAVQGWSATDRAALARLLPRFVADLAALTRHP